MLLRSLFGGGHPVTAVGDPCQSIYGWRGASAGNLRRFTADFPVVARIAAVRGLGAHRPGPGAAAVDQLPERRAGPGRGRGRPGGTALRGARRAPAGVRAGPRPSAARWPAPCWTRSPTRPTGWPGRSRACWRPDPGCAPDGQPWPDGRAGRRPAVRHRGAVPQAVPVRAAAARHRGPRHPGRGGRPRRAARGARGAGRGGHAAGAARRGRVGRAGPPAHRPALADRPARPGGPRPPRPGPGPRRGRRQAAPGRPRAAAPRAGRRARPRGRPGRGRSPT